MACIRFFRATILAALVVVLCAGLAGCGSKNGETREHVSLYVQQQEDVLELQRMERENALAGSSVAADPMYEVVDGVEMELLPEYRIGAGDSLEIVYHIQYVMDEKVYALEVQDKINITFPFQPQFNTTALVRSDGRVSLPLVGDIVAAGLTTESLEALLEERYKEYIRKPVLTVSLQEFNVKIDELKKAITTAPRGQSKVAPVAPDGRISLPIIGNIQAAGYTVRELEAIINEEYAKYVKNLHTTLILNEIRHMKFYAFGEVGQQGVYEMSGRMHIIDMFAMTQGFTPQANLEEVLVFRNDGLREPIVFMVDVKKMLDTGSYYSGLSLRPGDVVYVPKDWISDANDMIAKVFTKGIYGIVPFQSTFNLNYDLRDTTPD